MCGAARPGPTLLSRSGSTCKDHRSGVVGWCVEGVPFKKESQMCKRAKRWAVAVTLAVAFSVGLAGTVRAAQGDNRELLDKFKQGVTNYPVATSSKGVRGSGLILSPSCPDSQTIRATTQLA